MITLLLLILCKNKTKAMKRLRGFFATLSHPLTLGRFIPSAIYDINLKKFIIKKVNLVLMLLRLFFHPKTGATSAC